MFEGLLEQGNEMQEKLHQELVKIVLRVEIEGLILEGDASGIVKEVTIAPELLTIENKVKLEDLFVTSYQEFQSKVAVEGQKISEKLLNDLLPGGFGNLFG